MKYLLIVIFVLFNLTILSAKGLITFKPNTPAKASEVNANFTYLQNRMMTPLVKINGINIAYYINQTEVLDTFFDNIIPSSSTKIYDTVITAMTYKGYFIDIYSYAYYNLNKLTNKTVVGLNPNTKFIKLYDSAECGDTDKLYTMSESLYSGLVVTNFINESKKKPSIFSNKKIFRTYEIDDTNSYKLSNKLYIYKDISSKVNVVGLYRKINNDCLVIENYFTSESEVIGIEENNPKITGIGNNIISDNPTLSIEAGNL